MDRVRMLLYIDQSICEGFEVEVTKGGQKARSSFKANFAPATGLWKDLDLEVDSRLDPAGIAKILPPGGASAVSAFTFEQPPSIEVRGHFDGPAAGGTPHKSLHAEVRSDSALRVHGVAFSRALFKFDLHDDDVDVTEAEAGFAGGTATGKATISGSGDARRLRFKAALTHASLGQSAATAEGYVKRAASAPSTALGTFAREKADVRLDLNVTAAGRPGELDSFVGDGNVQIQGTELGALSLLGGLSRILKVTELRFTQVQAEFKIENGSLFFPELNVIGANSAIKAKGSYSIDRRQLDFSARIYPFQESRGPLQIFNAISAPFSAVFSVKLTGGIDKPSWSVHPMYSALTLPRASEVRQSESGGSALPPRPSQIRLPDRRMGNAGALGSYVGLRKARDPKHVAPSVSNGLGDSGPMDHVTTLPRRTWTERASLALAAILVVIGLCSLTGWLFHIDFLVQPFHHQAPIKVNEALCLLAIGLALLGREFGITNAALAAAVPALVGAC